MEANFPDDLEGPRQSSQMDELQQGFIWWMRFGGKQGHAETHLKYRKDMARHVLSASTGINGRIPMKTK